jgi:hypothetical protein
MIEDEDKKKTDNLINEGKETLTYIKVIAIDIL